MGDHVKTESTVGDLSERVSYEKLFRHWELHPWSVTEIDFSVDAVHWNEVLTDIQREAALWHYAMFLVGEEEVTRTLTPVADAAPGFLPTIYLTTQISDEARHHVFFDRFLREVASQGRDIDSTLKAAEAHLTPGFRRVFEELDRVTGELRRDLASLPLLAQSVAIYHIVVEGVLAIPSQHFIQRYIRKLDVLPGFREGIDNVSRDEARHVTFGMKFLKELMDASAECRAAAIEMWNTIIPYTAGVFIPPNRDNRYVECFDFTLEEIYEFGITSFVKRLHRMGVDPAEIPLLDAIDPSQSYDELVRKADILTRAGDRIQGIGMSGVPRRRRRGAARAATASGPAVR